MKLRILIAAFILLGASSCAQRIMCPTYAVEDHQEVKSTYDEKKSM